MLCCECGPRNPDEKGLPATPRSRRPSYGVGALGISGASGRALSPVSAYCKGELGPDELKAFGQLKVKNQELRKVLRLGDRSTCGAGAGAGGPGGGIGGNGGGGGGGAAVPAVEAQVEEHLSRLRYVVAENARLRADIARLQDEHREASRASAAGGAVPPGSSLLDAAAARPQTSPGAAELGQPAGQQPSQSQSAEGAEFERQATDVMAEIQRITQANIEHISQYDEKVKHLEAEIVGERRRRQTAEIEMRVPASMRSLSPMRAVSPVRSTRSMSMPMEDAPSAVSTTREPEEMGRQRQELEELEQQCTRLTQDWQRKLAEKKVSEERAIQELQLGHEVQREELEHFRRLVQEKRHSTGGPGGKPALTQGGGAGGSAALMPPNTGALLEAELEQLREHLAQVQQKGEQERQASELQADELRRETREIEKELAQTKTDKADCLNDLEEAKRAGPSPCASSPEAAGGWTFDAEKQTGEAMVKEIERAHKRISGLDAKVEQLEQEAKDIGQRANSVLRAVPDKPGGQGDPAAAARAAELQAVVNKRQQMLDDARREEDKLRAELAAAEQAQQAAKVEATVMEQKMKLLKSRTTPTPPGTC